MLLARKLRRARLFHGGSRLGFGQRLARPDVTDARLRRGYHVEHALLKMAPRRFDAGLVERALDGDRFAPDKDAAAKRQRDMHPVPCREHTTALRCKDDRHDWHTR